MYCRECGAKIEGEGQFCPSCGAAVQKNSVSTGDDGSFVWGLLGFLVPIVGLILYLSWKDTKPISAKKAGKGALISVIISVVLSILAAVLSFIFVANL